MNLLVIPGAPKCGTSALSEALARTSSIHVHQHKEPHFFSVDRFHDNGVDYYVKSFGKTKGIPSWYCDASTSYSISIRAHERIHRFCPSAKFVVLVRDPVDRVISHYRWLWSLGQAHDLPYDEFAADKSGFIGDYTIGYNFKHYIDFSRYDVWVPQLQSMFGHSAVLLIKQNDLKLNARKVLKSIQQFLQLHEDISGVDILSANVTESKFAPRWPLNHMPLLNRAFNSMFGVRNVVTSKRVPYPDISEETIRFLEEELSTACSWYKSLP